MDDRDIWRAANLAATNIKRFVARAILLYERATGQPQGPVMKKIEAIVKPFKLDDVSGDSTIWLDNCPVAIWG